jgi:hypothetical protein
MGFCLGEVKFLALVKVNGPWMRFWLGKVGFLSFVKVAGSLVRVLAG